MDNESVTVFARNKLVVITPAENPGRVYALSDLAGPGLRIVTGTSGVPVGNYTLQVLDRIAANASFGPVWRERVLANVISQETTVKNVVAKVALGEADAGFVYLTDAMAQEGLRTIDIPDCFNVVAEYPIGALSAAKNPNQARDFRAAILAKHGFIPVRPAG
jgi:molybdate transport system substrate-binding protein